MIKSYALPIFDPGGRAAIKTVSCVKVVQTEGMHDTAIITLRGENTSVPELQPGTPVKMQYGWQAVDLDYFYGYIDHIENHYDRTVSDLSTLEDVVCIGASYTLKDPFIGAWSNVQASQLVEQIANQYFLATVVQDDDPVWPQLAATGDSAWCFLTQLAEKTGYTFACNKTRIRFVSVDIAMQRYWPSMPTFVSRNVAPNGLQQNLSVFQSLTGESNSSYAGGTKAVRNVSGLDLRTGNIITASNDTTASVPLGTNQHYPFFAQQISDTVVTGQGNAQATLQGMADSNRWVYQAIATVSGLTTVRQGVPVVISGIDAVNDGIWWVQCVVHKIESYSYSLDLSLGRDSYGDKGVRAIQGTAVAFSATNPFAYTISNAPPTVLVNNRWRAAHSSNFDVC